MHMITDEYRLLRRLGRGGMGEVWEAARVKENGVVVPCAIKLLHEDITETARERKLFFDEARIATQLDHSRIVKVVDVGTARNGQPFLVMERVDGVDLRFFWKEAQEQRLTPLDIDIVTYIIGEVLSALDYAHDRTIAGADAGIIHSDVTPGNILISSSGEVKLTDFGIARFAATAGPMSRAIGTPRYMAPEQLAGTPRRETDIYGLGVVLHELLDDRRFLDGLPPDEFRARVMAGPPPELERAEPIPEWLDDLRRRMIATNYRDRPRASEARAVLIDHCPRFLAAGEQLKTKYYARLIGRRRSGVTQLLARVDDAHAAGLIPQIGRRAVDANRPEPPLPSPTRTYTAGPAKQSHLDAAEAPPAAEEWLPNSAPTFVESSPSESEYERDPVEATEVLPAVRTRDESSGQEISLVGPPPEDRIAVRMRRLSIASAVVAVVLLIPPSVLLLRGEPEDASAAVVEPPPAGAKTQEATTAVDPPPPPPPTTLEVEPPVIELKTETDTETETETETDTDTGTDDTTDTGTDTGPDEEVKPKPKPKPAVKIGLSFIIQNKNFAGSIKVGREVVPLKSRAAFLELRPATYTVSLQPAGSNTWKDCGTLKITDISPLGQMVNVWFDPPKVEKAATFTRKDGGAK